ncbi:MAG: hypothetical protein PWP58_265, partial [Bacillota bacterium]|nr:hypothetical protein [Bacillota bacterium]
HEALYRTPKGAYFLYGEGGAKTKYGRPVGGGTVSGGSDITPLTPDEALGWLEEHAPAEVIEREFPDKVEEA